jgi:hypothetical protein
VTSLRPPDRGPDGSRRPRRPVTAITVWAAASEASVRSGVNLTAASELDWAQRPSRAERKKKKVSQIHPLIDSVAALTEDSLRIKAAGLIT